MSGRKQRQKLKEEVHVEEPAVEEVHEEYDVEDGIEMVQDLEPHEEGMMEQDLPHDMDMEVDVNADKKKTKKKRKPAYAFFVSDNRKQVSLAHPDLSFGQTTQKLAAMWRSMAEVDRAPYEQKADEAQRASDFAELTGGPVPADDAPKKRGRKRKERKWSKDPTAPKKALTPYIVYGKEVRETVTAYLKEHNPESKPTDIMREISQRWQKLSAEEKIPFEAEAAKDRLRYETEKKAWMESQPEERTTTAKKSKGADGSAVPRKTLMVRARGDGDVFDKVFLPAPFTYKNLVKRIQSKRDDHRAILEIVALPNHRVRDQDDVESLTDMAVLEVTFAPIQQEALVVSGVPGSAPQVAE